MQFKEEGASKTERELLAASILTSNVLVGFFPPACLSAEMEDPEGRASPDGNPNYSLKQQGLL